MTSGTFTKHTGGKNNFLDKLKKLYFRKAEGIMWAFKKKENEGQAWANYLRDVNQT